MDKRFRRIPKVSFNETPSLTLTEGVTEILIDAGLSLVMAESHHEVALPHLQKLCKDYSQNALFWRIQADIQEIASIKADSTSDKERYLQDAKHSIREAYELSHKKNMVFSTYLGYLMNKSSNDPDGCMEALDQLNESLKISNPIDPIESDIVFDDERTIILQQLPTPVERIEQWKKEILQYMGQCVLKMKRFGTSSSIIKEKLQGLELQKNDKVKLYWISLSEDEKKKLIPVKDLMSHFKNNLELIQVLSDALSFYENNLTHKWKYWKCCSCSDKSPSPTMNFGHVNAVHLGGLFSRLKTVFPLVVDHNYRGWIREITGTTWRAVILEEECSLKIQASSTFELLGEVNPYSLVRDHECERLLSIIQDRLKLLVSSGKFVAAHMNILMHRSMMLLDGTLGRYLRHLGLDKRVACLCHLNADQLQDIYNLLDEMSNFTVEISDPNIEQTLDSSMLAFKLNGVVSLSSDYVYLVLDEHSLTEKSSSETSDAPVPHEPYFSNVSPSGNSSAADDDDRHISVLPYVDDLVTWVYSDHSSDECLQKWKHLLEERGCLGKGALDKYEGQLLVSLSNVQNCNENEKNSDSKLTNIEKQTLRVAMDMHQLEVILNLFTAYDYQPIVLSMVKQYCKDSMDGIIDSTLKSDGAADWHGGPRG